MLLIGTQLHANLQNLVYECLDVVTFECQFGGLDVVTFRMPVWRLRCSYILNASLATLHYFLASGDFCRLLITFANLLTFLIVFLKEVVLKKFMLKKVSRLEVYPASK